MTQASQATTAAPTDPPAPVTPVRTHRIAKLGGTAGGRITYAVGVDADGTAQLAITANEGGGYFSPEWVPLARVRAALADRLASGEPFATQALRPAYRNRSVNNACFLAAVLRHEGLTRAGAVPHLHVCEDGWDTWEAAQRASAASVSTPEPEAGPGPSEPVHGKPVARERRRGQRPTHTEDPGHGAA